MLTLFTFGLVTLAVAVVFAPILFALHLHRREERMATHGVTAVRADGSERQRTSVVLMGPHREPAPARRAP